MAGTDIYTALKQDHREVEDLFERIMTMGGGIEAAGAISGLADQLSHALTWHIRAEEETFYDYLRGKEQTRDLIAKSYREHKEGEQLLRRTTWLPIGTDDWLAQVGELRKAIKQHIIEEEADLFTAARRVLSEKQAKDLARRFELEKQNLMGQRAA